MRNRIDAIIIIMCISTLTFLFGQFCTQVMDDRWESEISEYGAINITGFRIVDTNRRYVKDFLDGWKRLDPVTSVGAGKESISVCFTCRM